MRTKKQHSIAIDFLSQKPHIIFFKKKKNELFAITMLSDVIVVHCRCALATTILELALQYAFRHTEAHDETA